MWYEKCAACVCVCTRHVRHGTAVSSSCDWQSVTIRVYVFGVPARALKQRLPVLSELRRVCASRKRNGRKIHFSTHALYRQLLVVHMAVSNTRACAWYISTMQSPTHTHTRRGVDPVTAVCSVPPLLILHWNVPHSPLELGCCIQH